MLTDAALLDLIGVAYDAATDPQCWTLFLEKIAALFHTGVASFDFFDLQTRRGGAAVTVGISAEHLRSYIDYYSERNDLWPKIAAAGLLMPGAVVENRSVYSDADFSRTEYCADYLQKQIGVFHAMGGAILKNEKVSSNISILRRRSTPFEDEERKFVAALMPHLLRSVSIWQRLAAAEIDRTITAGAIDRLPTPTVLLDGRGTVLRINPAAKRTLDRRDGLRIDRNRLVADSPAGTIQLQRLIEGATGRAPTDRGGVSTIERRSGKRPLIVSVAPLFVPPHPMMIPEAGPGALILISDPEQQIEANNELLQTLHGLTPAEAHLVALLLDGRTLKEVSAELHIALGTARTHLKRVMTKTNTRRQSELLLLCRQTMEVVS